MERIVEWFGGIGSFSNAMKRIKIKHEIVDYVDNNKHAVTTFNQLNNTKFVVQDLRKVDVSNYGKIDYLVAGWPCQGFSANGLGQGLDHAESNLIITTLKKLKEMQFLPKIIILENVPALLWKKHQDNFLFIKEQFIKMGYHWELYLLNAKYFGVPHARKRVYIVCSLEKLGRFNKLDNYISKLVTTADIIDFTVLPFKEKVSLKTKKPKTFKNQMYENLSREVVINFDNLLKKPELEINRVALMPSVTYNMEQSFFGLNGVSPTILAHPSNSVAKIMWYENNNINYRALTPLECWKLMGFTTQDYEKIKYVKPRKMRQLAGNSIVVNVLEQIILEVQKRREENYGKTR